MHIAHDARVIDRLLVRRDDGLPARVFNGRANVAQEIYRRFAISNSALSYVIALCAKVQRHHRHAFGLQTRRLQSLDCAIILL